MDGVCRQQSTVEYRALQGPRPAGLTERTSVACPISTQSSSSSRHRFQDDGIAYLLIQFVDIHGAAKVKLVPAKTLRAVAETGAGFAGGAVWGMGQGPHSHDMFARADLGPTLPCPTSPASRGSRRTCTSTASPIRIVPASSSSGLLAAARGTGLVLQRGHRARVFPGRQERRRLDPRLGPARGRRPGQAVLRLQRNLRRAGISARAERGLDRLGWGVYQTDHEDANFQYEVNFQYADALTTADRLHFFPDDGRPARSAVRGDRDFHGQAVLDAAPARAPTCTIIWPMRRPEPICFSTESDPRGLGLSALAYHFIGGVLDHAPALCAVTSPTVNCYKRLQMGPALTGSRSGYTWTPAFISYGDNNRTQMLRVPEGGHIEDRSISSACNPYLGIAAYLAAGLDGIARKLDPGEPNLGNLYTADLETMARRGVRTLPQSLPEALAHFERDSVVRESLGPIADEFLRLKRDEWREYHAQVESWEIKRGTSDGTLSE